MKRKWKLVLLLMIVVVAASVLLAASYEIGNHMRIPSGGRIVLP